MSESPERVVIYRCAGDAINEDAHTKSSAVSLHNMYHKYDRIYQQSGIAYMQKRMSNNVLILILGIYVLVPALIYWGNPSPKPPGADGKKVNIE